MTSRMLARLPKRARIVEVGPRDGLQNERSIVPTSTKLELIRRLEGAGLTHIEVGSFVSPKWVPQMSDSFDVLSALLDASSNRAANDVAYPVLVPNETGMYRALEAGAKEIAVFASASEGFSRSNINATVSESLTRFEPVMEMANSNDVKVRGYVSCVLGCPFDGVVQPSNVTQVARALIDMGCYEVSLGDTIGIGTPKTTSDMLEHVITSGIDPSMLAVHFHDTYGQALANIWVALSEFSIDTIDSSVSGLGGCPYAKGATGNVSTEDVVYMLHGCGVETGVNLKELCRVGEYISHELGRPNGSNAGRAILAKMAADE